MLIRHIIIINRPTHLAKTADMIRKSVIEILNQKFVELYTECLFLLLALSVFLHVDPSRYRLLAQVIILFLWLMIWRNLPEKYSQWR